jgi:hypothetical protein
MTHEAVAFWLRRTTPNAPPGDLDAMLRNLTCLLDEELKHTRRLAHWMRLRLKAQTQSDPRCVDVLIDSEREVLLNLVLVERDRIASLTEIGQLLGHRHPSRLRLAELILHCPAEQRDELLDLREEFRDLADDIERLGAALGKLKRQRVGRATVYFSDADPVAVPAMESETAAAPDPAAPESAQSRARGSSTSDESGKAEREPRPRRVRKPEGA